MRKFRIITQDNVIDLNIKKAVAIKSPKKMFTLEELKDGSYRLIWSDSLVSNFSEIKGFEIIREELQK